MSISFRSFTALKKLFVHYTVKAAENQAFPEKITCIHRAP